MDGERERERERALHKVDVLISTQIGLSSDLSCSYVIPGHLQAHSCE